MSKKYSKELKMQVVQDYLNGIAGYGSLAKKYGVSDKAVVRKWVEGYQREGVAYFEVEHRGKGSPGRPRKVSVVENPELLPDKERADYYQMENDILKKLIALMENK